MQDTLNTPSTVVITGASSGIGLGLAQAYLERGFNVVANARTDERLAAAAKQLGNPARFLGVAGDIGRRDTAQQLIDRAVERFGKVDVLVNNAGTARRRDLDDVPDEDWQAAWDLNVMASLRAMRALVPGMRARGWGRVVNVSSTAGKRARNSPSSGTRTAPDKSSMPPCFTPLRRGEMATGSSDVR